MRIFMECGIGGDGELDELGVIRNKIIWFIEKEATEPPGMSATHVVKFTFKTGEALPNGLVRINSIDIAYYCLLEHVPLVGFDTAYFPRVGESSQGQNCYFRKNVCNTHFDPLA